MCFTQRENQMMYGSRIARERRLLASSSPTNSSLAGSNLRLRLSHIQMFCGMNRGHGMVHHSWGWLLFARDFGHSRGSSACGPKIALFGQHTRR